MLAAVILTALAWQPPAQSIAAGPQSQLSSLHLESRLMSSYSSPFDAHLMCKADEPGVVIG